MGYYSNLAVQYLEEDDDRSYPPPEQQLLWRLEDLQYKLEDLIENDAKYCGGVRLTDDDIRYAIPEYFGYIADVERAIELATQDLKNKYDIDICDDTQSDDSDEDPQTVELSVAEQLSLFDILPLISQEPPLQAA